jgi:hypothetical protein
MVEDSRHTYSPCTEPCPCPSRISNIALDIYAGKDHDQPWLMKIFFSFALLKSEFMTQARLIVPRENKNVIQMMVSCL